MHWFSGFEHLAAKPWVNLFAGQATEFEKRVCSGTFLLMPFWWVAFVYLGPLCFDQPDSFGFWLFVGGLFLISYLWLSLWVRFIPAKVSWVAGTIAWLAVLGLALTGRI